MSTTIRDCSKSHHLTQKGTIVADSLVMEGVLKTGQLVYASKSAARLHKINPLFRLSRIFEEALIEDGKVELAAQARALIPAEWTRENQRWDLVYT